MVIHVTVLVETISVFRLISLLRFVSSFQFELKLCMTCLFIHG